MKRPVQHKVRTGEVIAGVLVREIACKKPLAYSVTCAHNHKFRAPWKSIRQAERNGNQLQCRDCVAECRTTKQPRKARPGAKVLRLTDSSVAGFLGSRCNTCAGLNHRAPQPECPECGRLYVAETI